MSRFSDAHQPGRTTTYASEKYKIVAPMDMTLISDGVVIHSTSTSSVKIARETDIENIRGGASLGTVTFAETDNGVTVTIGELLDDLSMLEQQTGTSTRTWTDIPIIESFRNTSDGTVEVTEKTVDGEAVALDTNAFGKTVHLQLMGYLHDLDEDRIVGRFYWIFPSSKLTSNLDITYEEGDNEQELVFEIQEIEGTATYGHRVIVLGDEDNEALAIAKPGGEIVDAYESAPKNRATDGKAIFGTQGAENKEPGSGEI